MSRSKTKQAQALLSRQAINFSAPLPMFINILTVFVASNE
jgi:hypothetical protein